MHAFLLAVAIGNSIETRRNSSLAAIQSYMEGSMLNELLFTQAGKVAPITACVVGVEKLFYAEVIILDKCDPENPL